MNWKRALAFVVCLPIYACLGLCFVVMGVSQYGVTGRWNPPTWKELLDD